MAGGAEGWNRNLQLLLGGTSPGENEEQKKKLEALVKSGRKMRHYSPILGSQVDGGDCKKLKHFLEDVNHASEVNCLLAIVVIISKQAKAREGVVESGILGEFCNQYNIWFKKDWKSKALGSEVVVEFFEWMCELMESEEYANELHKDKPSFVREVIQILNGEGFYSFAHSQSCRCECANFLGGFNAEELHTLGLRPPSLRDIIFNEGNVQSMFSLSLLALSASTVEGGGASAQPSKTRLDWSTYNSWLQRCWAETEGAFQNEEGVAPFQELSEFLVCLIEGRKIAGVFVTKAENITLPTTNKDGLICPALKNARIFWGDTSLLIMGKLHSDSNRKMDVAWGLKYSTIRGFKLTGTKWEFTFREWTNEMALDVYGVQNSYAPIKNCQCPTIVAKISHSETPDHTKNTIKESIRRATSAKKERDMSPRDKPAEQNRPPSPHPPAAPSSPEAAPEDVPNPVPHQQAPLKSPPGSRKRARVVDPKDGGHHEDGGAGEAPPKRQRGEPERRAPVMDWNKVAEAAAPKPQPSLIQMPTIEDEGPRMDLEETMRSGINHGGGEAAMEDAIEKFKEQLSQGQGLMAPGKDINNLSTALREMVTNQNSSRRQQIDRVVKSSMAVVQQGLNSVAEECKSYRREFQQSLRGSTEAVRGEAREGLKRIEESDRDLAQKMKSALESINGVSRELEAHEEKYTKEIATMVTKQQETMLQLKAKVEEEAKRLNEVINSTDSSGQVMNSISQLVKRGGR